MRNFINKGIFILGTFLFLYINTQAVVLNNSNNIDSKLVSKSIESLNNENCEGMQLYEAEEAILTGTTIETSSSGYSGSGYVFGFDNDEDKVSFEITVDNTGNYPIQIAYSAPADKQNYLYVNGVLAEIVYFPQTNGFTEIPALDLTLNAGVNTVEIVKYWGWFELDYIKVSCSNTPEPEQKICTIGTNFWDIRYGNTYEDVFLPNIDFATTSNPWNPTFLEESSIYSFYRLMTWGPTKNSPIVSWSDRISPTSDQSQGVAYEWQIDLCNRQGKDLWICIPHQANDDFIQQLATLIKDNLDPNLMCYIEYSNETWNSIFEQAFYCYDQAQILGLPGADPWESAFMYQVIGAINVWENFEQVFGGEMDARINKVLAGWQGNSWLAERHLNILDNPAWNPSMIQPDSYAVGSYAGHSFDGNDPLLFEQMINDIYIQKSGNLQVKNLLEGRCYEFLCYEGGQHVADYTTSAGNYSDVANTNPEMYDFYTLWLEANKDVFDQLAHYCHTGVFSTQGSWGAKEYTGQPNSEAHKYRAILDWINNNDGNCPVSGCGNTCTSDVVQALGLKPAQQLSAFLLKGMDHNLKNIQSLYIQNQNEIKGVFTHSNKNNKRIKELVEELKPTVTILVRNAFGNKSNSVINEKHIQQFNEFLFELENLVQNLDLKKEIMEIRNSICVMEGKGVKQALKALDKAKMNECSFKRENTISSDIVTFDLKKSINQIHILNYDVTVPGKMQIQLFDLNGKLIITVLEDKMVSKGKHQQQIVLNDLNTNLYLIRATYSHENGKEYFSEKVLCGQ